MLIFSPAPTVELARVPTFPPNIFAWTEDSQIRRGATRMAMALHLH